MTKAIQLTDEQYAALQAGESITIESPKRTMTYTVERPEPMLTYPKKYQEYCVPVISNTYLASKYKWHGDFFDLLMFNRGLCYETEEEAIAAVNAMVGEVSDEC